MIRTLLFGISLLILPANTQAESSHETECIKGSSIWYQGTHNHTRTGIPCQRWDSNSPHKPLHTPRDDKYHNYCRNPHGELNGTWCYTTDPNQRWDYCNISKCADDSLLVWTNFYNATASSRVLSKLADPELAKEGNISMETMIKSSEYPSEFWAITGDYNKKVVIYSDYLSNHVEIFNYSSGVTAIKFEGMASSIESMAYDWVTENLFWTDYQFNWIIAIEKSFTYYAPIYRSKDKLRALAINPKQRKLYFSTYKENASKIIETDLAGKNEHILFQYPDVFDVNGITVDYTGNRLYWTDFNGIDHMVVSGTLEGKDKRIIFTAEVVLWGIASYLDYIYVTQINEEPVTKIDDVYYIWTISKTTTFNIKHAHHGRPRRIDVLTENSDQEFFTQERSSLESCWNQPACDHICLSRANGTRECVCSVGYHRVGDVGCELRLIDDEFMYVADAGQSKIFQIPLNSSSNDSAHYSIVPVANSGSVFTTLAVNSKSQFILWSDKRENAIKHSLPSGSNNSTLTSRKQASSLVVDPLTKNTFFLESNYRSIYVMSPDGSYLKAIKKNASVDTSIGMIALDSADRKIYWTDTQNRRGHGQVWRMNLDGSKKQLIWDQLDWPHALTIDQKSKSLFVSEEKTAKIYEVSLKSIHSITSTASPSILRQYNLSDGLNLTKYQIIDVKVHDGIIYFLEKLSKTIYSFNISMNTKSLTVFSSKEFYSLTSLAIHSRGYYDSYIATINSPCLIHQTNCTQICVDLNDTLSKCLCEDGYSWSGKKCVRDETISTKETNIHGQPGSFEAITDETTERSSTLATISTMDTNTKLIIAIVFVVSVFIAVTTALLVIRCRVAPHIAKRSFSNTWKRNDATIHGNAPEEYTALRDMRTQQSDRETNIEEASSCEPSLLQDKLKISVQTV